MRKIYTRVVIDIATGNIDEEESYLYEGHVAECKGGGSTDAVDEAYNARMATIYEAQEKMAEEYYDYWKDIYKPYETAQVAANTSLIPSETALALAEANSNLSLLPYQTEASKTSAELTTGQSQAALELLPEQTALASKQIADTSTAIDEFAPVRSAYTSEALEGVNVQDKMNQAASDAWSSWNATNSATNRGLQAMGLDPSSGAYAKAKSNDALNLAKNIGTAKTAARTDAENENYTRLKDAATMGLSYTS
ncbi:MAG: hypothetical protein WCS15_00005 [Prevotella sp.]